jgi:adenine specific DNA methylase Mod
VIGIKEIFRLIMAEVFGEGNFLNEIIGTIKWNCSSVDLQKIRNIFHMQKQK